LEIQLRSNEKNTFDLATFIEFRELLRKHSQNQTIRVLLFSSGTPGYFSNGIEPRMLYGKTRNEVETAVQEVISCALEYFFFPLPTIALVSGHAVAAGAVFALFSDYRWMVEERARIGFSESLVGLNFPSFPTRILSDLVGARLARDLLYTGRQIKSKEALEIGLVDGLFSEEALFSSGMKEAQKLAKLTRNSSQGIKAGLRQSYRALAQSLYSSDVQDFVNTILSPDGQEGFLSILEGRRPRFS